MVTRSSVRIRNMFFLKIYILDKDEEFNHTEFIKKVENLVKDCEKLDICEIKQRLKEIVPSYRGQKQIH